MIYVFFFNVIGLVMLFISAMVFSAYSLVTGERGGFILMLVPLITLILSDLLYRMFIVKKQLLSIPESESGEIEVHRLLFSKLGGSLMLMPVWLLGVIGIVAAYYGNFLA